MNTRKLGGLGLLALALAIVGLAAFAQQGQTQEKKGEHGKMMQECAKACSDCQRVCDSTATHCARLLAEGKKEHLKALGHLQDCATCCSACAQVCARGGPQALPFLECCAKSCDLCAKECEAFPDDKHMKSCAEECRKCEKMCKAMLKHMSK